jgi:phage terminase large subunit-like protein
MTDPTNDRLTVATDPPLSVTRGGDGSIHITASSEGVTVALSDVPALVDALKAFATTAGAESGAQYGDALYEIADPDESDAPEKVCPDCGAPTREGLGGRACPECGWVE